MATFLTEMTPGFMAAIIADLFNEHGKAMLGDEITKVAAVMMPEGEDALALLVTDTKRTRVYRIDVADAKFEVTGGD